MYLTEAAYQKYFWNEPGISPYRRATHLLWYMGAGKVNDLQLSFLQKQLRPILGAEKSIHSSLVLYVWYPCAWDSMASAPIGKVTQLFKTISLWQPQLKSWLKSAVAGLRMPPTEHLSCRSIQTATPASCSFRMPFVWIEPDIRLFYNIYSPRGDQIDPSRQTVLLLHPRLFDHEFMEPQYTDNRLKSRYHLVRCISRD